MYALDLKTVDKVFQLEGMGLDVSLWNRYCMYPLLTATFFENFRRQYEEDLS